MSNVDSGYSRGSQISKLSKLPRTLFGRLAIASAALGLFVRLTVRDSVPYVATLYYATPWPVLAVGFFVSAALLRRHTSRKVRRCIFAAATVCVFMFVWTHYESPTTNAMNGIDGQDVRVAFWNVARGVRGWDAVLDELQQINADVFGLVEVAPLDDTVRQLLQSRFPDFEIAAFPNGMAILSRYPISSQRARRHELVAHFGVADISVGDEEWRFVVADIDSNPLLFRRESLEALNKIAMEEPIRPTVVMGDLNTPIDSVFFQRYRKHLTNTIEEGGQGLHCTWPVPCPVMAIDHMWANNRWQVKHSELGWTWISDHRPIVSTLRLLPSSARTR